MPILGKLWIDDEGMHFEMDEGMKPDDRFQPKSHVQHVTKDEDTHQYRPKGSDPDETYETPEKHNSPWLKEWIRLGEMMEGYAPYRAEMINFYTVDAVIHAQMLKRPS